MTEEKKISFWHIKDSLRANFIAGLLFIIPAGVTIWIITVVIRATDRILHLIPPPYRPQDVLGFKIPGLGIILVLVTVLITGFLVRNYLGGKLVALWEKILDTIPVVGTVHSSVKQVVESTLGTQHDSFKRAVLLEYPRRGMWVLGFVSGTARVKDSKGRKFLYVFVPTTPNPTSGFLVVLPEEDVRLLDITVEEAFRLVISSGIAAPLDKDLVIEAQVIPKVEEILEETEGGPQ